MYLMCLSKGLDAVRASIAAGVLPNKTLGFIPTAGEPYENPYFVKESRERLRLAGVNLIELDITGETAAELLRKIDLVDGVFVAGGNSFYLLSQLKKKGIFSPLKQKVIDGMPYFGESAGAVILCASIESVKPIDDPLVVPDFTDYRALGLTDFFVLPHIDREKYRSVFTKFQEDNREQLNIVPIRDDQALITRDGSSYEIVDSPILTC